MNTAGPSGFPGGGAWGQAQFARQVMARRARLPVRLGVLSALLVGVIPIVLMLLGAVLVGGLVYLIASLIGKFLGVFGIGDAPRVAPATDPVDDGRENVKVMDRSGV